MNEKKIIRLTRREIILRRPIIAMVVTLPSIAAFLISWQILDNLIQSVLIGAMIHFIALVFSLKISKKFLVKRE